MRLSPPTRRPATRSRNRPTARTSPPSPRLRPARHRSRSAGCNRSRITTSEFTASTAGQLALLQHRRGHTTEQTADIDFSAGFVGATDQLDAQRLGRVQRQSTATDQWRRHQAGTALFEASRGHHRLHHAVHFPAHQRRGGRLHVHHPEQRATLPRHRRRRTRLRGHRPQRGDQVRSLQQPGRRR